MATEATFTLPPDEFPLGIAFEELSGVTIELERIVPGVDNIIPYFWVRQTQTVDIEAMFTDHPGIHDVRLVDSVEDEHLLRIRWDPAHEGVLSALSETGVTLINAVGTTEQWTFDVRGENRGNISEFQQLCRARDIPTTLTALQALTPIETKAEAVLTEDQQEALILAYRRGYFNTPREVTLEQLGEELGISQQAVSSRIRRGTRRVLGNTLSALEG